MRASMLICACPARSLCRGTGFPLCCGKGSQLSYSRATEAVTHSYCLGFLRKMPHMPTNFLATLRMICIYDTATPNHELLTQSPLSNWLDLALAGQEPKIIRLFIEFLSFVLLLFFRLRNHVCFNPAGNTGTTLGSACPFVMLSASNAGPATPKDSPKMAHRRILILMFSASNVVLAKCTTSPMMAPGWLRMAAGP